MRFVLITYFILCLVIITDIHAQDVSGYIATESRIFPQSPLDNQQHGTGFSLSVQPEFYFDWANGRHSLLIVPFARLDQYDDDRTHWDIREFYWLYYSNSWEIRVGIRKIYWGVTESQHLVDVINQTDFVENIDGEQKLGQPMINFALIQDWGTLDFFLLTGFRERTFPGAKGRLRFPVTIDAKNAGYEAKAEQQHIDWAIRWAHTIGAFDLGLSYFSGTSREPRYMVNFDIPEQPVATPFYDLMNQIGLDAQFTSAGWLWKLEAISRYTLDRRFNAFTGGFEYTFSNISNSGIDVGALIEYLFDNRDQQIFPPNPFDNHLFAGSRLAFNDVQSTELLAGAVISMDNSSMFHNIEASRRLGQQFKLNIELRGFGRVNSSDFFYGFRNDTHSLVELEWYF